MRDGIIVIHKEQDFTSFDVVAKLRGILRVRKMGHTGTLDPMATGVLPIAVGKGTRLVELLTEKTKEYETTLRLGMITDTEDVTGEILETGEVSVTEDQIQKVCASMLGEQMQVPPMYSALKVDGKRLYELAREGKTIERKARPVTFYEIEVLEIDLPRVRLRVSCSKGTYIRSLCRDIGEKLGCGACMERLCRTRSGEYTLNMSHTLAEVQSAMETGRAEEFIIPVEEVLCAYPQVHVLPEANLMLENGNPLNAALTDRLIRDNMVRMYDSHGDFVALYEWKEHRKQYFPVKMFGKG